MPSFLSNSASVCIGLGLVGIWGKAISTRAPGDAPSFPLAALAWAQANCDPSLKLRSGTPRVQAEDLFRISAAYDSERGVHGLKHACRRALQTAEPVIAGPEQPADAGILAILASLH